MYKVGKEKFSRHTDAVGAAKAKSRVLPVILRSASGHAWYWRGRYCGRHFIGIFKGGTSL